MARTAVVRSASLAPEDAERADQLATLLAGGSFTELTRLMLRWLHPVGRLLDELQDAGVDPHARLALIDRGQIDSEAADRLANGPSTWPAEGPKGPPPHAVAPARRRAGR